MLSTGLISGSERRRWGAEVFQVLPGMEQKQAAAIREESIPSGAQSKTVLGGGEG